MKVIFVTYDFPYPTNTGGKNRAYHMLKYAAKHADITLYSFVRDDFNADYVESVKQIGINDIKVFKRRNLKALGNIPRIIISKSSVFKTLYWEEEVLEQLKNLIREKKADIIHFESAYTGYYIGHEIAKTGVKQVLGTENIEYLLYQDYAKNMGNILSRPVINYQAKRLEIEEKSMMKSADLVTAITPQEGEIISSVTGRKTYVVANGIDMEGLPYKFEKKLKNNMLFVGNFSYFPNVDAMNFFYHEVFKKIKIDTTLTIVGKQVREQLHFNDERIILKDFVEDIVEEYRNADVLVFPVRVGGGTNFKVLEAMALGVPIIALPERLAGLNAKPDVNFMPANTPEEFLNKIELLYSNESEREEITKNARELIEGSYSWEKIVNVLVREWKSLLTD